MTDAHCHVSCGDPQIRELLIGRDFFGVHPWETLEGVGSRENGAGVEDALSSVRCLLSSNPRAGVGEIGLDRMKVREVPPEMRAVFEAQLKWALELGRPVVLHGARCWGQVLAAIHKLIPNPQSPAPKFLFHGFSRSDGLIPDIVNLGGFISVGPAVLNDHAVNYRAMVQKIPLANLLVETDRTEESAAKCPGIADVLAKVAEIRGVTTNELELLTDKNAERFYEDIGRAA